MTDLHYANLVEVSAAIQARKVSPLELTRSMLDRIARVDPLLCSYATVTGELALSGSPTITLPGGFSAKGLPLSFQLVGRNLEEALLLRAGHAYQRATQWHSRHPSL